MVKNEQRKSSKRGRMLNYSGSTSNFHSSQEPERSTPSYNYASSRCPDPFSTQIDVGVSNHDPSLAETVDLNVRTVWLEISKDQRYLLLEDTETGDVLMPLTKLKELLGDNYSRVLSNTDSRFVVTHDALDLGPYDSKQQLYWLWPFESPPNVKSFIRRELQDHSTGHIRLVLVPIVYNAMVKIRKDTHTKDPPDKRVTPNFLALMAALGSALRSSSYAPLLQFPDDSQAVGTENARQNGQPLFDGPSSTALTAEKYMSRHKAASRKRAKQEAEEALRMRPTANNGVAELRAEVQMFHDHIDRQAKKLGALEEALQETKTMFSRLYQFLTAQEQGAPQHACHLETEEEWRAASLTAQQMAQDTPKPVQLQENMCYAEVGNGGYTPIVPTRAFQCPGVNPLAMPRQMAAPVQHNHFPTVVNKAHHLSFPPPQTPDMQSLAESLFADQGLEGLSTFYKPKSASGSVAGRTRPGGSGSPAVMTPDGALPSPFLQDWIGNRAQPLKLRDGSQMGMKSLP